MRALAVCLSMIAMMKVCGAADPAPPVPVAAAPSFTLTAQHGGTVLRADDHWVEVVPRHDGTVEAYVVGPTGAPPPPATTVVTARVPASDRRPHDVTLVWSPESGRYEGRLERVHPVAGPVEVVVIAQGVPHRATAPTIVVVETAAPPVVVDARPRRHDRTVVVTEPAPAPGVVVVAPPPPRPGVVVVAPAPPPPPGIVVVGPAPPTPGVVVVAPRPAPGVVVIEGDHHHHHDRGLHLGHGGGHGGGRGHGHGRH